MGSKQDLERLQEQLDGLAKTVQADSNLPVNMADYLVTLNSLKERIEAAQQTPDDLGARPSRGWVRGTKTGRVSSKLTTGTPVSWDRMRGSERELAKAAMNPHTNPPVTDRRAAILHTRKLNESNDNS